MSPNDTPESRSQAEAGRSARASRYFINAPADIFLISGASLLTYAALAIAGPHDRTQTVIATGAFFMWIINWPHFSMTSYRLYASKQHVQQYPVTALVIPVLLAMGVVACFLRPELVAPYFVKLFLLWSPYHFSGQTVGITMIYARRNGFPVGKVERLAISSFVFGSFAFSTLLAEVNREGYQYWGIAYPGFGVPSWLAQVAEVGMYLAGVVFLGFVVRWCVRHRRMMPPMVVLPALTQYVWFVQGANDPAYAEFVPLFHSLQYILIAWGVQMKEKMDLEGIAPSKRYVAAESLRWYVINFGGGIALFWLLPRIGALSGSSLAFSTGVMIAAVQLHHFFVDGVIWKLRRRTNEHPLMMNVADVAGRAVPRAAT